jgi:hypothetical protein
MQDQGKTKEQLIDELKKMRLKVAEFEAAECKSLGPGKLLRQSEGLREIEKNLSNSISSGSFPEWLGIESPPIPWVRMVAEFLSSCP